MEIRVGPSFALSVLIAVAAAAAFKDLAPIDADPKSSVTPAEVASPGGVRRPSNAPDRGPRIAARNPTKKSAAQAPPRPPGEGAPTSVDGPIRPASASTTVELGESLVDVARRVYRSDSDVVLRSLWEANRDEVKAPRGPLPPGLVVRTP